MAGTIDQLQIEISASSSDAEKQVRSLTDALKKLKTTLGGIWKNPVASLGGDNAGRKATWVMASMRQRIKLSVDSSDVTKANKKVGALGKTLNSVGRVAFYRAIRTALKAIGEAFTEGEQRAYMFAKTMGEQTRYIADTYDSLSGATFTMENQLGAAWATLKATIAPIVIEIINLVTAAASAITQLFAILGGKGTYLKASHYAQDWADATAAGSASAKEWKNQLMGFDEINRLKELASGGGGGGASKPSDWNNMFEETPVDSWFQHVKDKLDDLRNSLNFEPLKKAWDELGASVRRLGDDIVKALGWAWDNLLVPLASWTIEDALPAGIQLVASALNFLLTVAEKLAPIFTTLWETVFQPMAKWIGDTFLTAVTWLSERFDTLAEKIESANSLGEFIQSLDGKETVIVAVATAIGAVALATTLFSGASTLARDAIKLFRDALKFLFSPATAAVIVIGGLVLGGMKLYQTYDSVKEAFDKVGEKLAEFKTRAGDPKYWGELATSIVEAIATAIGALAGEAWKFIKELFKKPEGDRSMEDIGEWTIEGVLQGIKNKIASIGEWLNTHVLEPFKKGFKEAFGIASPAKETQPFGKYIWEGVLEGIKTAIANIGEWLKTNVWEPFKTALEKLFSPSELIEFGKGIVAGIGEGIKSAWTGITSFFGGEEETGHHSGGFAPASTTTNNRPSGNSFNSSIGFRTGAATAGSVGLRDSDATSGLTAAFQAAQKVAEAAKTAVSKSLEAIKSAFTKTNSSIVSNQKTSWNQIQTAASTQLNTTKNNVNTTLSTLSSTFQTKTADILSKTRTAFSQMNSETSKSVQDMTTNATSSYTQFQQNISSTNANIKSSVSDMRSGAVTEFNTLKSNLTSAGANIRTSVTSDFNTVQQSISGSASTAVSSATSNFNNLASNASSAARSIQSAFNFNWSIPHMKVPHLTWTWEETGSAIAKFLGISKIPRFSVQWYAKGGIVDGPTLFGAGEAGREAIIPLERNTEWISRVAREMNAQQGGRGESIADGIEDSGVVSVLYQILSVAQDISRNDNGGGNVDFDAFVRRVTKVQRQQARAAG